MEIITITKSQQRGATRSDKRGGKHGCQHVNIREVVTEKFRGGCYYTAPFPRRRSALKESSENFHEIATRSAIANFSYVSASFTTGLHGRQARLVCDRIL
jgi:hypothetical protein